jgi:hypothetical protein
MNKKAVDREEYVLTDTERRPSHIARSWSHFFTITRCSVRSAGAGFISLTTRISVDSPHTNIEATAPWLCSARLGQAFCWRGGVLPEHPLAAEFWREASREPNQQQGAARTSLSSHQSIPDTDGEATQRAAHPRILRLILDRTCSSPLLPEERFSIMISVPSNVKLGSQRSRKKSVRLNRPP